MFTQKTDILRECSLTIDIDEFVKFYLTFANKSLNHLGIHSENVSIVASCLAKEIGYNSAEMLLIKYAGLLHDIGKLFVPAEILNSARALTSIEFEIIKTHASFGYGVLDNFKTLPKDIKYFAYEHHYRQGYGYPKQLLYNDGVDKVLVDILTIADSFSAIMEPRVYKRQLTEQEAYTIMTDDTNEKNKGLNLEVLEALKYLIEKQKITLKDFF